MYLTSKIGLYSGKGVERDRKGPYREREKTRPALKNGKNLFLKVLGLALVRGELKEKRSGVWGDLGAEGNEKWEKKKNSTRRRCPEGKCHRRRG